MNFEFGDKQQIEYAKTFVVLMDDNRPARWRARQKIGMLDKKGPAVPHLNRVWTEWPRMMYVS